MIENNRIRTRRFADAVRLYDSYLFILRGKKRSLTSHNKLPSFPPTSLRASRSISSLSQRKKRMQKKNAKKLNKQAFSL